MDGFELFLLSLLYVDISTDNLTPLCMWSFGLDTEYVSTSSSGSYRIFVDRVRFSRMVGGRRSGACDGRAVEWCSVN